MGTFADWYVRFWHESFRRLEAWLSEYQRKETKNDNRG